MNHLAANPYLPFEEYVPDGEPYVFGERVYVYGSHDRAGCRQFCVQDYVVWSASCDNLEEWNYEGVSYKRTDDPHNADGERALFAPDVVRGADGKYYLYYCLSFLEEFGVAVSDKPAGPFQFYGHVKYEDGTLFREGFPYDPSVLMDDDGRVYLYYGFVPRFQNGSFKNVVPSPGCMVVELQQDMLTVKGHAVMCLPSDRNCEGTSFPKEHAYFEAPSIRKIGNVYYLFYSSQQKHELCYAVSEKPMKNFVFRGSVISNGDIGLDGNREAMNYIGTNHGGIVKIKNQWYIFYHRNTHGVCTSRQGCAEQITFDAEGRIRQVPMTSYGLRGKPFDGRGRYPAYIACVLRDTAHMEELTFGKDVKETAPYYAQETVDGEKQHFLCHLFAGVQWGYRSFHLEENTKLSLMLRGKMNGMIEISADYGRKNVLGIMRIDGNCEEWTMFTTYLQNQAGITELYFTYEGEGSFSCKELWLQE